MENIVESILEEYTQYYNIHDKTATKEEIIQKEKGLKRMQSMAETYFKEEEDYQEHVKEARGILLKEKYAIAVAFITDTVSLIELNHRGFYNSDIKEYTKDFKIYVKDLKNLDLVSKRKQ